MAEIPKKFKIITLGCKVNQYESSFLKAKLLEAGWVQVSERETADVAVINTCVVTQTAGHQSRQAIRKAIRENPEAVVGAVGCYPQVSPEELSNISGLGFMTGNRGKSRLPQAIIKGHFPDTKTSLSSRFEPGESFDLMPISNFPDRSRAYLKIQDGCECFCSYCIVPFSRGPYRSLAQVHVLSQLEDLIKVGFGEVVLTGIHLGKYGADLSSGIHLKSLLKAIGRHRYPIRIRLSSLEVNEIDDELIQMVSDAGWICRHFHIPLQSGDDNILERMNRPYEAKAFSERIEAIHSRIPLAAIGLDVMAGFPGEDNEAHQNTYRLIKNMPISYLHVFPYSRRPGTVAADFSDQVDAEKIKERATLLRNLGQEKKAAFYASCVGGVFQVLLEGEDKKNKGYAKGMTDNYLSVLFLPNGKPDQKSFSVRMDRAEKDVMWGTVWNDSSIDHKA